MREPWALNLMWWITAVELPVLAGLFLMMWRQRRETEADIERSSIRQIAEITTLREALANHRLEVAKSYASIAYLQEVERRLTRHLIRIENKLDGTQIAGEGDLG